MKFLAGNEAFQNFANTSGLAMPPLAPVMPISALAVNPPTPPVVSFNERAVTKIEISPDGSITAVTSDGAQNSFVVKEDFAIWANEEGLTSKVNQAKLSAAKSLLDELNTTTLPEARREIERARKALAKAETAIEKESEK